MRTFTGFLTRERNYVVPACDGVFTRYTCDSLVRRGAVKTHFRCAERIEGVLLQWTSPVLRLGQVKIIRCSTRFLARSKSHRINPFPARRWNAKNGGCGPPIATHGWLGWRFVELKGIHVNKNHCGTQLLEAAKKDTPQPISFVRSQEWQFQVKGKARRELYVPGAAWQRARSLPIRQLLSTSVQRTPIADLQSFGSHQVARPGAAPGHFNLVFDPRPMRAERSLDIDILYGLFPLHPSETSTLVEPR